MVSGKQHPPVTLWLARLPGWLLALCFGAAYFGCAKLSVLFSVKASPFITFWLPVGLYVGALLLTKYRHWPWLIAAALAGNFAFDLQLGTRPGLIVFFYLSNTFIATTSALLLRRFIGFQPAISSLKELTGLFGLAGVISAGLGALIGAVGLIIFQKSTSLLDSWVVLWADDVMAILLLTPLLLTFCAGARLQNRMHQQPAKWLEAALLAAGLTAVTWQVFNAGPVSLTSAYKFELIPFLLWSGLRFGPRGAASATFGVALMMAYFVSRQLNRQTGDVVVMNREVFLLQAIVIVAAVVAIIPAVVLEERDRTLAILRESEEKFSKAFRTSPDAMSIKDLGTGHYLDVNEAFERIYGFKREEVLGRSPADLGLPENPAGHENMLATLKTRGVLRDVEIKVHSRESGVLTLLHSADLIELGGRPCELGVSHDITAMRHAEAERSAAIAREQKARIQYTIQLIASQEAERTRIARELHDSLGQNLLLVKNRAQMALLPEFSQGTWQEQVQKIIELSTLAIAEVRQISRDLHPYQLDHVGFTRAVSLMFEDAAQASGIAVDCKMDDADDVMAGDAAMNFYRVIQECLNNIIKHSRAKNVTVRLERDLHELQLLITDDGCGFGGGILPASGGRGLGLKNINERMRMLDGTLQIDSLPGRGTRIKAVVPITARPA